MYTANHDASEVLDVITHGLSPGDGRCIDCAPSAFLPLYVECLGDGLFTTAHYAQLQGDLEPDPDVEWWHAPRGTWVPLSIVQITGHQLVAVEIENGVPARWNEAALRELVEFCNDWLGDNFVAQQGGLDAIRQAVQSVSQHRPEEP